MKCCTVKDTFKAFIAILANAQICKGIFLEDSTRYLRQNFFRNSSICADIDDWIKRASFSRAIYIQRNLFEILLYQTDIRFYLPFCD